MTDLEKLVERITACATTVHENMGPGFPEKHYQEAMIKEFASTKLAYNTKEAKTRMIDGAQIGASRMEFFVENIMIELKALPRLEVPHMVHFSNGLKKSEKDMGMLINFGTQKMQIRTRMNEKIEIEES